MNHHNTPMVRWLLLSISYHFFFENENVACCYVSFFYFGTKQKHCSIEKKHIPFHLEGHEVLYILFILQQLCQLFFLARACSLTWLKSLSKTQNRKNRHKNSSSFRKRSYSSHKRNDIAFANLSLNRSSCARAAVRAQFLLLSRCHIETHSPQDLCPTPSFFSFLLSLLFCAIFLLFWEHPSPLTISSHL